MNTITLSQETVQQALDALEGQCRLVGQTRHRLVGPAITTLRATLQQAEPQAMVTPYITQEHFDLVFPGEPLERLTHLTEEMGLYPWQEKSEPQAQVGYLHLKPPFEDENGNDISGEYITPQSHREALADMRQVVDALLLDQKRNQVRTAKKDAALKACVSALNAVDQEIDLIKYAYAPPNVTLLDVVKDAVTQAKFSALVDETAALLEADAQRPEMKPLTDEQIGVCIDSVNLNSRYGKHHFGWHLDFARSIEAEHSIK